MSVSFLLIILNFFWWQSSTFEKTDGLYTNNDSELMTETIFVVETIKENEWLESTFISKALEFVL